MNCITINNYDNLKTLRLSIIFKKEKHRRPLVI